MNSFSIQTVTAITEVVTGGSGGTPRKPAVGYYRSGPELEQFFGVLNLELHIGSGSRVPTVRELLTATNRTNPDSLVPVIEAAADPRDYLREPEKLVAVTEYLNQRLRLDGYELREVGGRPRLMAMGTGSVATSSFGEALKATDFDSAQRDFERAIAEAESDPEGAITSACSIVESVCKCILDEIGEPYPAKQDIQGLVREVARHLGLSPDRPNLPAHIEDDVRRILGGLATVTTGIGALRTHGGDAHGRGKGHAPVDARIARLAIHAASTVAFFYIETWNHRQDSRAKGPNQ